MLPYINFFGTAVPTFNFLVGLGAVIGILVFYKTTENKIYKADIDNIIFIVVISVLVGFISGMLFDKFVHFKNAEDFFNNLFKYTGITFLGGFIGGIFTYIVMYGFVFNNYSNILMHLDFLTPPFAISSGIGRLGCLAGGCCFGKPCVVGFKYPVYSEAYKIYGDVRILPIPLIESIFLIVLAVVLLKLVNKNKVLIYIIAYSLFRFFIEFFRGDDRGKYLFGVISPSQCICIALIVFAMLIWIGVRIKYVKSI